MSIPQTLIPALVEDARCAGVDPELFFPSKGDSTVPESQWEAPRRICKACPVQAACLTAALEEEHGGGLSARFGMRGGLSPRQRALIQAPSTTKRGQPAECGTTAGYRRHRALGTQKCRPCLDAWAEYMRRREASDTHRPSRAQERAAAARDLANFEAALDNGDTPDVAASKAGHRTLLAVSALARRQGRPDLASIADKWRRAHAKEAS